MKILLYVFVLSLISASCKNNPTDQTVEPEEIPVENWVSLFNGENLDGWTPKFSGSEYGVNYKNTFGVEDGAITVSYDEYETFNGEFGHLFYKAPFSKYRIKMEYRIYGEQCANGPGWAFKNSGLMYHCQDPSTMDIDQSFPICLEGQFLGGNGTDARSTMNLCTPSTHVTINGEYTETHCIESISETFHTDEWVAVEFIVNGGIDMHHLVGQDTVFSFTNPVYGGGDLDNHPEFTAGDPVTSGYIALQAESHPVAFKNIRVLEMD